MKVDKAQYEQINYKKGKKKEENIMKLFSFTYGINLVLT